MSAPSVSVEREVEHAGRERERRRVRSGGRGAESGRARQRRDHGGDDGADRAARAGHELPRRAEERVRDERGERGVEPVLDGLAGERRVAEALRDEQRPDGEPGDRVVPEPTRVVARQPADDRQVATDEAQSPFFDGHGRRAHRA
jgi:hypothetical protein